MLVSDIQKHSLWKGKKMLFLTVAFLVTVNLTLERHAGVSAHGHSHDEPEVNPSFKYSRAANAQEDEIMEDEIVDLPPRKGPPPKVKQQGHNHGGHGHSHGGHSNEGRSQGGHGHSHGPPQQEPTSEEREKHRQRLHKEWDDDEDIEIERNVWLQAISATLLISAAPFFILFFIPLDNSQEKRWIMKITLSFASGGLLGDAFLHLIPHAMMAANPVGESGHGHSHGHSHGEGEEHAPHDMSVGLGVLAGILAFLAVEKFVRILNAGSGGHGHSHAGIDVPKAVEKKSGKDKKQATTHSSKDKKKEKDLKSKCSDESDKSDDKEETVDKTPSKSDTKKDSGNEKDKVVEKKISESVVEENGEVKVAGYLNLVADAFHNFTDGLAIGASFAAGKNVGMVTTFTILFHEIPHEIGDYAILIQSGVPPMKAILLQSLTAIGALAGCIVALLAQGGDFGFAGIILPFTAGGFIYIATVSVIPELLEGASSFRQSVMEIIALISGVVMMVIIAQYE